MSQSIHALSKAICPMPHFASSETEETESLNPTDCKRTKTENCFDPTEYVSQDECKELIEALSVTHPRHQQALCHLFAQLKHRLALGKREFVTYIPLYHCVKVASPTCSSVQRVYDLCDLGLRTYSKPYPRKGGGGVKQLLIDQGLSPTNKEVRDLTYTILPAIGKRLMQIAQLRFKKEWFDWGAQRMNFPFTSDSLPLKKMIASKKKGLFAELLYHWHLIDWTHGELFFTKNGAQGFIDIYKALFLRMSVLNSLNKVAANRMTPHPLQSLRSFEKEKQGLQALKKELESVNMTILHLTLMAVNANMGNRISFKNQHIFYPVYETCKHLFLPFELENEEMDQQEIKRDLPVGNPMAFMKTCIRLDQIKNNAFDKFVKNVVCDLEQFVLKKTTPIKRPLDRRQPFYLPLNPLNPFQREIGNLCSDIGGLLYDSAIYPTPEPVRLRKIAFYKKREELGWQDNQRRSRILEFLVAGALHKGEIEIRGFRKEPGLIQKILMEGLIHFKRAWAPIEPLIDQKGAPIFLFNEGVAQLLEWETDPMASDSLPTFLSQMREDLT